MGRKELRAMERRKKKDMKKTGNKNSGYGILSLPSSDEKNKVIENTLTNDIVLIESSKIKLHQGDENKIICASCDGDMDNFKIVTKFKYSSEELDSLDTILIQKKDSIMDSTGKMYETDNNMHFNRESFIMEEGVLKYEDVKPMFYHILYEDLTIFFKISDMNLSLDIYATNTKNKKFINIGACIISDIDEVMNTLNDIMYSDNVYNNKSGIRVGQMLQNATNIICNTDYMDVSGRFPMVGITLPNDIFVEMIYIILITLEYIVYVAYNRKTVSKESKSRNNTTSKTKNKYTKNKKENINTIRLSDDIIVYIKTEESRNAISNKIRKKCEYSYTVTGHWRHYKNGKKVFIKSYVKNKGKEFKPKHYTA